MTENEIKNLTSDLSGSSRGLTIKQRIIDEFPIEPIFFMKNGNCSNNGLYDLPLEIARERNLHTSLVYSDMFLDPLNENSLYTLQNNNKTIIVEMMDNYIKKSTFASFCNIILSDVFKDVYELTPILSYVQEELEKDEIIISFLRRFIFSKDEAYSTINMDNGDLTRAYADNLTFQIAQVISLILAKASEDAINEVLLQVRITPCINNIYNILISSNKKLKEISKKSPDELPIYSAILLKEHTRSLIETVIYNSIGLDLTNLFYSVPYTSYFIYEDYAKYDLGKDK